MKSPAFGFALLWLGVLGAGTPAQAQNGSLTRSFVSSAGSDGNACTIIAPCATFAQAYTKVGAHGIVAALDPGKYGPLTITGSVTINGNGWAAITAPAAGNGITINANLGDAIRLSGLEIDGANAGYNGIVFNSGSSLTVTNCIGQDFVLSGSNLILSGNGVVIAPTTANSSSALDFTITNSTFSNNADWAIVFSPPNGGAPRGILTVDHVTMNANSAGIFVTTGGLDLRSVYSASITNSIVSDNTGQGILVNNSGQLRVAIDYVTITGNGSGIQVGGTSNVVVGHSLVNANGVGVSGSSSTLTSFGNNEILLNDQNVEGTIATQPTN